MDVHIISFEKPVALMARMTRLFPYAAVKHRRSVDLRHVPLEHLVKSKLISYTAANSITNGRRWHHEHSTQGSIGLVQAIRLSLNDNHDRPLLVLEEDCLIRDEKQFVSSVEALKRNKDRFDLAVFGILKTYQTSRNPFHVSGSVKWFQVTDKFWGLHCALYSPAGRRKLGEYLMQPNEMQVDSYYGLLAKSGEVRILGESTSRMAVQSLHLSSVQNGVVPYLGNRGMGGIAVLCCLIGLYIVIHKKST